MSEKRLEMPFLRNVGLVITYRCQVACPHCIIEAGPNRTEEMALNDVFNWIQQISKYRDSYIKILSLTGGEPFFNIDNLKMISTYGEKCGLLVTAVTNAFWASTKEKAVKILQDLSAIKILSISTDVYHLEAIPFKRVKNAVIAAKECDIPYNIAVCTENEEDAKYERLLHKLKQITEADTITPAVTLPVGRALKKIGTLKHHMTDKPPIAACSAGSSPILFPNGQVIACIGPIIDLPPSHPLVLGNLRDNSLDQILDKAELNPILHAIRIWGPKKLISLISEAGLKQYLPKQYIKDSVCNACYDLMSNSRIIAYLAQLEKNSEFRRKVAYARIYYLNETRMVETLC